jgi:glycosyltransferase involved in cell wall biosynthesis
LLSFAIESVLAQTVAEFELCVVCDGAPLETIDCAQEFAQRDSRVTVRAFPKGARQGEAHYHSVLTGASGNYVAYLEDDDLWFPNHLEELEKLLLTVDFGHTIHVIGHPDGHVEALPSDISIEEFRQRFLDDLFNRFGLTVCGHRLAAYRRLPEAWAPTPLGMYPDLHMWRKFMRVSEFKCGTRMLITAVTLPSYLREHMSLGERASEARVWLSRIRDDDEQSKIVEAAWRSVVGKGIQNEQEIRKINSSYREAKAAVHQMAVMYPGSLEKLGHKIAADADAALEVERLAALYHLSQHSLSFFTANAEAERKRLEATISAYQAELVKLNNKLVELRSDHERIVRSKSWRLTQTLRMTTAAVRHVGQMLHRGKM